MKVYLATFGYDYSGSDYVIGVFTSREAAEKVLERYLSCGTRRCVSELVLDQVCEFQI